ncbi:MAG: glycosyltransferase family 39 protein [Kiritimatiellia bacterium]|nr:glycosyltransferase family 39 protein [Kiritimatiellia bacterium]
MIKLFERVGTQKAPEVLIPSLTVQPRIELVLLIIVICLAAFFRLYQLGEPAFRADTMIFMDMARQPIGPGEVLAKWNTTLGMHNTGQFPFAVAWTKLVLNITGAQPTPFMVRLPSALWGILAVLAIYGCGRVLAGNAFALFLAALFALNPFHIGISREAYFYPPLVCGSALLLWSIVLQLKADRDRDLLSGVFYVLLASGFFLTTYSQPSSWSFAFMAVLIILWFQVKNGLQSRRIPRSLLWVVLILVLIGIPLLFADWAVPQILSMSTPAHKEYVNRIFGINRAPILFLLARTLFSFCWGMTLPRILFTIVVLLLGLAATIRLWRRSLVMPVILILLAGGLVLYVSARYLLVSAVSSRYLLAFLPLYLIWLALGLWFAADILCAFGKFNRRVTPADAELHTKRNLSKSGCHSHENGNPEQEKIRDWIPACAGMTGTIWDGKFQRWIVTAVSVGIMIIALGLNIWPAWLATQLTGKPIPYWDIVRWCDKSLPPRSLVLVERWLDPWNELRVHNSTNVFFTFPVPSEPPDVFAQVNWPLAARQFMEKFPDAAYLEFSKSTRERNGLITNWSFAKSVSFTNEAAIKLARLGLAHREEFFDPQTNRLIVTVFYNTREDAIAHARNAGKQYLTLYGPEWGYVKLWQQLRDFRDWRILENQASLDIYNLTSSTNRVTLKIRGMAMNGMKRVEVFGEYHDLSRSKRDFRHLQMDEWILKDVLLRPGLNKVVFSDSLWSVAKIPLLVDQIEVDTSRVSIP